jgi:hypothetical protein
MLRPFHACGRWIICFITTVRFDVAKEALRSAARKDLSLRSAGVREGRRTFANTLKYYKDHECQLWKQFAWRALHCFLPFFGRVAGGGVPKNRFSGTNFLTDFPAMANRN